MADPKPASAAGSDAEVFLSASDDEAPQQEVTPELLTAVVKQVEFYFSDANLPTDKKLLKQIRKDPEGYVPVKLFANFRKVRALTKDVGIITEALRGASLLQLSDDAKRVKRIVPVPEYDVADIQRRTIVVENLPGNPSPTIESVTEVFRMYGRVKLVRICSRESKGKLPSWLTSSCQNMAGQQHAYVEFEEEEGAVLAAAALAAEGDPSDGTVQVRRLLNCIAEHRERRSNAGTGSSYGGSRKGSRDVSPLGSRASSSRRNSSGGGGSFTCASSSGPWGSVSSGGASVEPCIPSQPFHHHSYGGAFEHGIGSRRGSGGGCAPPLPPAQPPPPPRRSCDSAPPSELLPAAVTAAPVAAMARLNIYRPPAKRVSDGYAHSSGSTGGAPALQRSCGASFNSGVSVGGAAPSPPCAPASPTASLPPPPPPRAAQAPVATASPPLATRDASVGGGKPPAHPPAALAANALAEAIAAVQAERRASEAGAKAGAAAPQGDGPYSSAAAVAAALAPMGRSAPKFCLNMPARGRSLAGAAPVAEGAISTPRQAVTTGGAKHSVQGAVPAPAADLPRNAQMVANVEDFINSILSRPVAASQPPASAPALHKASAAAAATAAVSKPTPRQTEQVDAAAAVAGILASALRRPVPSAAAAATTLSTPVKPAVASPNPPVKMRDLISPTPAPAVAATIGPEVYITAVAPGEADGDVDIDAVTEMDLEHAVKVTVHPCSGTQADGKALKVNAPTPAVVANPAAASFANVGSGASSATSSPREAAAENTSSSGSQARSGGTQRAPIQLHQQPQQLQQIGKRHTRREYAQWAAATPEFRAEAASKYGAAAAAEVAMVAIGGVARCSAGGIPSATASPLCFTAAVPSSISDGGAVASPAHTPVPHAPAWHVARGPDGSRGFTGRRALAQ